MVGEVPHFRRRSRLGLYFLLWRRCRQSTLQYSKDSPFNSPPKMRASSNSILHLLQRERLLRTHSTDLGARAKVAPESFSIRQTDVMNLCKRAVVAPTNQIRDSGNPQSCSVHLKIQRFPRSHQPRFRLARLPSTTAHGPVGGALVLVRAAFPKDDACLRRRRQNHHLFRSDEQVSS